MLKVIGHVIDRVVTIVCVLAIARSGHSDQRPVIAQIHETHTHGVAAGGSDLLHPRPDHNPIRGNREDLIVDLAHDRSDKAAALLDELHCPDAHDAAALGRPLLHGRPLGESAIGHRDDERAIANNVHAEELVIATESHTDDAAGRAPHGPKLRIVGVEPHRETLAGNEEQVIVLAYQLGRDDLIAVAEVDGDDTTAAV